MYIYENNNNGYLALGPVWQEPEPSQATGMAPICCILGKFLGVVCHCFPPRLDVPTFAARCLHVLNNVRDPSSKGGTMGKKCPVILLIYSRNVSNKCCRIWCFSDRAS